MKYSKYKAGDRLANKKWFNHCLNNQIPLVIVEYRTTLADVEFDYFTFNDKKIDNKLKKSAEQIRAFTYDLFKSYKNSRSELLSAGWGVIRINNLEISSAEDAAEEIYDYINLMITTENA